MSIYVLVLSDFIPFVVGIFLFCVSLRPMQNKELNDNVRGKLLPLSRKLLVD